MRAGHPGAREPVDAVEEDGQLLAVAGWRRGAPHQPGTLPTVGGLLTALLGRERAGEVGAALALVRPHTPAQPHAYLQVLAVAPELQGRGLGRQVLAPGLRRADEAGIPVHLETASPSAGGFYRRLGLTHLASVPLADDGPTLHVFGGRAGG